MMEERKTTGHFLVKNKIEPDISSSPLETKGGGGYSPAGTNGVPGRGAGVCAECTVSFRQIAPGEGEMGMETNPHGSPNIELLL
jgi:hypothetical protein